MRTFAEVVCPRCEQGWVTDQVVEQTGDRWRVCDECDAVWHVLEPIRAPGWEDLSSLLRLSGLTLTDARLRDPGPDDPDPLAVLEEAFERCHDADPGVRQEAVATLAPAVLSSPAGTRLAALLHDPSPQVAAAAAAGLARYGDEASFETVAARVHETDGPVRAQVVRAVADMAGRHFFAAHRLVRQLDAGTGWPADLEQAVRGSLAPRDERDLVTPPDPADARDVAASLAATRSESWERRREAVRAAAPQAARPAVRERLVELFDDPDLAVVAAAALALVEYGGDDGADAVLAVWRDGPDDAGYAVRDALAGLVRDDPGAAERLRARVALSSGPAGRELLADLRVDRPEG